MNVLRDITEAEMVAVFLSGEINSPRWGKQIESLLTKSNIDKKIILFPNIKSTKENKQRALVLGEFRGYGQKGGLFDDLEEIKFWKMAKLEKSDFKKIKYIDYDYWVELSGKTGLVVDGVENIKKGVEIFGISNQQFWQLAEIIKNGGAFPPLILTSSKADGLKILEGHVRLTAYLLANDEPKPLEVIVGVK